MLREAIPKQPPDEGNSCHACSSVLFYVLCTCSTNLSYSNIRSHASGGVDYWGTITIKSCERAGMNSTSFLEGSSLRHVKGASIGGLLLLSSVRSICPTIGFD